MLGGNLVSWRSRKQQCISLSSCEAEYVAANQCGREIIWLRRLISFLGHPQQHPTDLHMDSRGAMALTEAPIINDRSKHIPLQYH